MTDRTMTGICLQQLHCSSSHMNERPMHVCMHFQWLRQ